MEIKYATQFGFYEVETNPPSVLQRISEVSRNSP